jgi:hypothetical protein
VRTLAILVFAACSEPQRLPTPGCDPGTPGLGDATSRPLAVVGDRVSDRLELYSVDPLTPAGCVGMDENAGFIDEPFDLAAHGDALYVVLGHAHGYDQGTLVKLHLPDGARLGEVTLGEEPSMIALSADGKRAWISLFRNLQNLAGPWVHPGAVVEVNTDSMTVTATSPDLCNAGLGIALDEARHKLWVACPGSDQLALVDVSGPPVLDHYIELDDNGMKGVQPAYVLLDGKHAFVTAQASDDLWIFDQESTALTKRLAFESGTFPQRMAAVPNSRAILVALDYSSALAAIDTEGLVVADRVPLIGVRAQGVAVTADSHWALVTDERDLMRPGHLARVDLTGLGVGGAHLDGTALAAVFPQAVIVLP